MTDKVAVKFLTAHTVGTLYNKDDVAGFDGAIAGDLIDRGIAVAAKGKKVSATTATDGFTKKKVGEGWSVFSGKKEVVKGLADENAADAWIAEQGIRKAPPEARQVGETWSVFSGDDVLVADLSDEAAAKAWIADQPKA